ncbi:MAG TPA: hypothetical protein ACFYD4_03355 [Candidatus Wunengus sp. YC61]|uniref:hypothetical protein n=1 Tax=Candidatus Wunengus sp. YC61 TaxID=3367698 RepID=UPI00402678E5
MEEPKASVSQGTEQFIDDGSESIAIGDMVEEPQKEDKGSDAPAVEEEPKEKEGDGETQSEVYDDKEPVRKPETIPDDEDIPEDQLPKGVLKRIGKMRKIQGDAEREAERLRVENESLKRAQQVKEDIGDKPDLSSFETEYEYIEALTDWKVKKAIAEQETKKQEQEATELNKRQEKESEERHKEVQKKLKVAGEKYKDFSDVVYQKNIPITETIVEVISRFDNMGDVAYYLGKHPDECLDIAHSGQLDQVLALRDISDSLKAREHKTTKTPAPIRPISGTGAGIKDLESMSYPEYRKVMEKREKEARGG